MGHFLREHLSARPLAAERQVPLLTVAFSGGVDSSVLLHVLAQLASAGDFALQAAHVHHGLSAHADTWAAHCQAVCDQFGVPLLQFRVSVAQSGHGVEAAARQARHGVLASLDTDWIVLGHHADDQAETLLHRLIRGTGVRGAAAMRSLDSARRLMRPLLHMRRHVLESYAQAHLLAWVDDDSNPDTRFTRNFLRHDVLRPLAERFPEAATQMSRAAAHFAEAQALLESLAAEDLSRLMPGQAGSRDVLRSISLPRARNLLRYWLGQAGCRMPEESAIEEGLQQLRGPADAVRWTADGQHACAYRSVVWLEPLAAKPLEGAVWRGETELPWGDGRLIFERGAGKGAIRLDMADAGVRLCGRIGGERLRAGPGRPSRNLRQWCQTLGIPSWWRESLPLLVLDERIVWIGGIGSDATFQAAQDECGWVIRWEASGNPPFLQAADEVS